MYTLEEIDEIRRTCPKRIRTLPPDVMELLQTLESKIPWTMDVVDTTATKSGMYSPSHHHHHHHVRHGHGHGTCDDENEDGNGGDSFRKGGMPNKHGHGGGGGFSKRYETQSRHGYGNKYGKMTKSMNHASTNSLSESSGHTTSSTTSLSADWSTVRSSFVPTKVLTNTMDQLEGIVTTTETPIMEIQKEFQTMRSMLNKISSKNYVLQRDGILTWFQQFVSTLFASTTSTKEEFLQRCIERICDMMCEIAICNKMYTHLYAELYTQMMATLSSRMMVVASWMEEYVLDKMRTFRTTLDTIVYCDPNQDYDGYCSFMKDNDRRRGLAKFLVYLATQSTKPSILETWMETMKHVQEIFLSTLRSTETLMEPGGMDMMTPKVEEMSEVIFVMISSVQPNEMKNKPNEPIAYGDVEKKLIGHEVWKGTILPKIELLGKTSMEMLKQTMPTITRRIVFKQLDLYELVERF